MRISDWSSDVCSSDLARLCTLIFAMSCRNVGRAADQHEAAVAVPAIDIAFFVDFHVDARMTERRSTGNIGCAVAGDAGSCNANGFGWLDHSEGFIIGYLAAQYVGVIEKKSEERGVGRK